LYKENEELKDFIGEMKIEGFFIKKKNLSWICLKRILSERTLLPASP
jgi:hypothetical protein